MVASVLANIIYFTGLVFVILLFPIIWLIVRALRARLVSKKDPKSFVFGLFHPYW